MAVPPAVEQCDIAAFLDCETIWIDALVAKKERLIELMEETRTALVTRAVTKGLDPTVPLKESGVEWLGGIPAHWDVKPLKAVSRLQTGLTLGKSTKSAPDFPSVHQGRPMCRTAISQISHTGWDGELPMEDAPRYKLRAGDLLTEGGDFDKLGRGFVWESQVPDCLHQNHIFAVRPQLDVLSPFFLSLAMSSGDGRAYFTATSKQSTNGERLEMWKIRLLDLR